MSFDQFKFKNSGKTPTGEDDVEDLLQQIVDTLAVVLRSILSAKKYKELRCLVEKTSSLEGALSCVLNMSEAVRRYVTGEATTSKPRTLKPELQLSTPGEINEETYLSLERVVQKYEAEIRDRIRMEQQMGIYTQTLEEKLVQLSASIPSKQSVRSMADELAKCKKELDKVKAENRSLNCLLKEQVKVKPLSLSRGVLRLRNLSLDQVS